MDKNSRIQVAADTSPTAWPDARATGVPRDPEESVFG